jgi:SAM-dependent methyltransferase
MPAFYPKEYEPHAPPGESAALDRGRRKDTAQRVALIERLAPAHGRVLDVGCATGSLLAEVRARGWESHGIEPDAASAAFARDRLGLDVRRGTLKDANFPGEHFDLVCFWHVLEHAPNPRETLREAARVARPGATLLLSLPDPGSWMAALFGPYWCGWDVPRHLCLFPRMVLARMLKETGWMDVRMLAHGGRHWYFTMSLENWARDRVRRASLARMICRVASSAPVKALTLPAYVMLERLGRGPNLLAIARRGKEIVDVAGDSV